MDSGLTSVKETSWNGNSSAEDENKSQDGSGDSDREDVEDINGCWDCCLLRKKNGVRK